jgi:hypothetical protein
MMKPTLKSIRAIAEPKFQRLFGTKKAVFEMMLTDVKAALKSQHARGGHPVRVNALGRLLITLTYWREYCSEAWAGFEWGIGEGRASEIIQWTEQVLLADPRFHLPGKKALREKTAEITGVIIDATECPAQRLKKKQRKIYSGKKKLHTQKAELAIDTRGRILYAAVAPGRTHDFKLAKQTNGATLVSGDDFSVGRLRIFGAAKVARALLAST